MPFAEYENFDDCVAQNSDKEDPDGYCASVMRAVEGKTDDTSWLDVEAWYNDRTIETFISGPRKDSQGDFIETKTFARILPWLTKYGYYEWQHSGFPIGKIIGWRIHDGKPQIRVGIHDSNHSKMKVHDKIWKVVKEYGLRGFSSIKGLPELQRRIRAGSTSFNLIEELGVYGVGWVGENPANPDAQITYVNELAKERKSELADVMADVNRTIAKGDLIEDDAEPIDGLDKRDSRIARELAETFAARSMTWEECVAEARQKGATDPEKISGWLFYRGTKKGDGPLPPGATEEGYRLAQERLEADSFYVDVPGFENVQKADRPPKAWWDNCVRRASSFATDTGKFCGGLWFHPERYPNGPQMRASFGKSGNGLGAIIEYGLSVKSVRSLKAEKMYEKCPKCRAYVDSLEADYGVDRKDAFRLLQKRLNGLMKLIEFARKEAGAKRSPPLREKTMSKDELEKQEPEEEAPAEAPPEEPAEEETPEVRDLAAEVDELKAQIIALAEAVAQLREGTEGSMQEAGAQAEEVAADTGEIETVEASKILDEKVEAAVAKALDKPARSPRGVGEDVDSDLAGGLSKAAIRKVGRGELSVEDWRESVGIRRRPA